MRRRPTSEGRSSRGKSPFTLAELIILLVIIAIMGLTIGISLLVIS